MLILIVIWMVCHQSNSFGFDTRSIIEDAASSYFPEKTINQEDEGMFSISRSGGECYGHLPLDTIQSEQTTDFLDMVNFMEFVQFTTTGIINEDFMNYYHIATAAMEYGNTFLAQEHMARALRTLENERRRKRDTAVWDAGTLFDQFREEMGEENFKQLLHLDRRVVMAFVIDTSSSMANDMAQVKQYILELVLEQERAGVKAEYTVTTFADPYASHPTVYKTKQGLMQRLESLVPSIGGDCEEKTCYGMKRAMFSSNFFRVRNSALYVFTDAASKDCVREHTQITRTLQYIKASAFFILFGTCRPNIVDNYYVAISDKSGGFSLLIRDNGIYNITDTVNGAFDKDSLICGEESDNSNSVIGQGSTGNRVKRSDESQAELKETEYEERTIIIDTSIERFRVFVTLSPISMLSKVKLEKPVDGDRRLCGTLESGRENVVQTVSTADDALIIDVNAWSCPCTGTWTLKYPKEVTKFNYKVRSSGAYLVDFEAYFVDVVDSVIDVANYSPCLGIEEQMVIKLNQGEKVKKTTLSAKILGLSGNIVHWQGDLKKDDKGNNAYVVSLVIPTDIGTEGFRIVLEGEIIDGTRFQRLSSNYFYPTGSCLRIARVSSYYALIPNRKTYIQLIVTNNNEFDEDYLVSCSNTMSYPVNIGGPIISNSQNMRVNRRHSNPVLLNAGHSAKFVMNIAAPSSFKIMKGRTVTVTCKVTSSTEELLDMILLTEMDRAM